MIAVIAMDGNLRPGSEGIMRILKINSERPT